MKKLLLISSFVFLLGGVYAQQDAQYSQFMFNRLGYNSAFAGSEGRKICITGLFRSQWLGYGNGTIGESPQTFTGNIHAPLGSKFGVGLSISNDKLGFESSINPILSFAYRYTFKNNSVLAAGVGAGIMQKSLLGTKLIANDKTDPNVPKNDVTGMSPDFNFGLYYQMPSLWRFDEFYAGLSATHLTQGIVEYGVVKAKMRMHYYFTTGAVYHLNSSIALEPNLLVKFDQAKLTTDVNVMAMYNEKIRGGLTYRSIDAIAILAGYKFRPDLQMGVSYDITTTKIRDFSNGTIEVMLKYCFMPKMGDKPEKPPIPRLTPRFL